MTRQRILQFDRLLTGDGWVEDAWVRVGGDGVIAAVEAGGRPKTGGKEGAGVEESKVERVEGWAVPGVPNVHSHAFQRAMAGCAEGRERHSFWTWRDAMYRFVERLTPDHVEAVAAQLYVELLKAGFTCVGEFHYLHHDPRGRPYADRAEMSLRILAAARTAGIGLVHMPAVYETGGFGGAPLEPGQQRFRLDLDAAARLHEALAPAFAAAGQRLGWAVHSLRAVSSASLRRIAAFLDDVGAAPVHIHVAEQEREVEECIAVRGERPVAWLLANAPVDERWCLVHATHMTGDEARAMAACGATAGLCPATEANLGDGLFPLGAFADAGGRFGVGTDSHIARSPAEELRLLEYGQRLAKRRRMVLSATARATSMESCRTIPQRRDRGQLRGRESSPADGRGEARPSALDGAGGALLSHAWRGGAQALAWNGGRVAAGARADFVVLDAEHPALAGREGGQVLDSWLFSGTDNPVKDVFVGGERVVQDGRHVREEEVARSFRQAARSLAGPTHA